MSFRSVLPAITVLIALSVSGGAGSVAAADDVTPGHGCAGAPSDAITNLPAPLDKWGQVLCTPYGQVLASHAGWMWLMPDLDPVLIPAQISDRELQKIGNTIYFTKIDVARVKGSEFDDAYTTFHDGFDDQEVKPDGYRVDLTTVEGKSFRMYFFDYDTYAWGMSCPGGKCQTDTRFMILDKNTRPEPRTPAI